MFASKTALFVSLFAVSAQLVAAGTPACLLGAINSNQKPWSVTNVCNDASNIESRLQSICGSNAQAAILAYAAVCKAAGKAVPTAVSSSATATASGSAATGAQSGATTMVTATGTSGSGSSATGSSASASPTANGAASHNTYISYVALMAGAGLAMAL